MRAVHAFLALLVFCLVPARASAANKAVGVLVTGDYLKGPTQTAAEKWLRAQKQQVVTTPLPADAVSTLLNCFVMDDAKCMRNVVDARAITESVVSIRLDVASKKQREVRITVDWFVKGQSPVSARRTCDRCTEDTLRSTVESMLTDLAKTVPGFMGRVKVMSNPPGITVMIDNVTVGVTPLDTSIPVGDHRVQLVRDGRSGEEKAITVTADGPAELTLEPPPGETPVGTVPETPQPRRSSRLLPGLCIGVGVAALAAGTTLYLIAEDPTGETYEYYDERNKPLGIGLAAGGGALLITGVIVILAASSSSTPTMAFTPGGATVGWAGSF